jgi:hypothetical protein
MSENTKIKNIEHIYVVLHKEKETDKYDKWIKWMKYNRIPEDYVTFYCYKWGDELSQADLDSNSYDDGTLVRLFPFRKQFPLKKSEISISINFLNIFKIGLDKKYNNILVFESDAILHPDFINIMNKTMDELPKYKGWHMLSIGCGMNKHYPNLFKNKTIYRGKEIRCLDSFVINQSGMKFLIDAIPKVNLPIDEHFDILVKQNKLECLWLEPTIVVQGSQVGINPTTIRYTDSVYVTPQDCKWLKDVQFK